MKVERWDLKPLADPENSDRRKFMYKFSLGMSDSWGDERSLPIWWIEYTPMKLAPCLGHYSLLLFVSSVSAWTDTFWESLMLPFFLYPSGSYGLQINRIISCLSVLHYVSHYLIIEDFSIQNSLINRNLPEDWVMLCICRVVFQWWSIGEEQLKHWTFWEIPKNSVVKMITDHRNSTICKRNSIAYST